MAARVLTTANLHDSRPLNLVRGKPRKLHADPPLLFWRRMIESAVAEAKKTIDGLPTDVAILARWWVADFQPKETEKDDWERSFACACQWLSIDATKERKKRLREIDSALLDVFLTAMRAEVYHRRARVLACAGIPSAIAKQFVLPLVAMISYDEVAGVETMDLFPDDVDAHVESTHHTRNKQTAA